MDTFLREINTSIFKKWLLVNDHMKWHISSNENIYVYENNNAKANITFHPQSLIEFQIYNKVKQEDVFYIHFQMNTFSHTLNLYNEFIDAIKKVEINKTLNILLSCTGGLTTSLFAMSLNEGAQAISLDYHFEAVAYNQLLENGKDYDIILLAPQISYKHAEVNSGFRHKLVIDIPTQIFASYNVGEMLKVINQEMAKYKDRDRSPIDIPIVRDIPNTSKILSLSVVRHHDQVRIGYRLYQSGNILLNNEIIKTRIQLNDIIDIINTVLLNHTVDKIGIAIPGIINDGVTILFHEEINYINVKYIVEERFHIPTIVVNDANAMAVGHYVTQDKYDNITFYFQPRGVTLAGAGNIINGVLHCGRNNLSGEMQYICNPLKMQNLTLTEDGCIQSLTICFLSIISTISPDLIIYYCELIPDTNKLIENMSQYISKDLLPEIKKTTHLKDYMLIGAMILASTN